MRFPLSLFLSSFQSRFFPSLFLNFHSIRRATREARPSDRPAIISPDCRGRVRYKMISGTTRVRSSSSPERREEEEEEEYATGSARPRALTARSRSEQPPHRPACRRPRNRAARSWYLIILSLVRGRTRVDSPYKARPAADYARGQLRAKLGRRASDAHPRVPEKKSAIPPLTSG